MKPEMCLRNFLRKILDLSNNTWQETMRTFPTEEEVYAALGLMWHP